MKSQTATWPYGANRSRHAARRRHSPVAPDGVEFVDGGTQFRGHDGLDARVRGAYEQFVAGGDYAVTSGGDVAGHGDIVMFTVQLTTSDGEVAWVARVFLLLGADGLIREDYQLTVKPLAA
jgi:hypothetical protein